MWARAYLSILVCTYWEWSTKSLMPNVLTIFKQKWYIWRIFWWTRAYLLVLLFTYLGSTTENVIVSDAKCTYYALRYLKHLVHKPSTYSGVPNICTTLIVFRKFFPPTSTYLELHFLLLALNTLISFSINCSSYTLKIRVF